ncbi:hypothetical protein [Paraburkholderia aromaticivorans]|uniref:hypothetical protein n=1 Tax=Paraburkholderia aromaticivorans TaxID=2026199 RepID=UPI001455E685|nr:hypothetical protein [Paraburkholderia aromaticivorans]
MKTNDQMEDFFTVEHHQPEANKNGSFEMITCGCGCLAKTADVSVSNTRSARDGHKGVFVLKNK